jgi:hypothetical protein
MKPCESKPVIHVAGKRAKWWERKKELSGKGGSLR